MASRLARLDRHLTPQDRQAIADVAGGAIPHTIISDLVRATAPDAPRHAARESTGLHDPPQEVVDAAQKQLLENAAKPLAASPELRQRLIDFRRSYMQTIDTVSANVVLEAGFTDAQAGTLVESFQQFIEDNRDEITALQALYERPYQQRLRYDDIKALADALQLPPRSWTTDQLWGAYRRLDDSRVRGSGHRVLADIVSLVRFAIGDSEQLTQGNRVLSCSA